MYILSSANPRCISYHLLIHDVYTRRWQIRIGIHTGVVVSGVVGERLPRFLVMGSAVNIASKMESHGMPDRIHVSQASYE